MIDSPICKHFLASLVRLDVFLFFSLYMTCYFHGFISFLLWRSGLVKFNFFPTNFFIKWFSSIRIYMYVCEQTWIQVTIKIYQDLYIQWFIVGERKTGNCSQLRSELNAFATCGVRTHNPSVDRLVIAIKKQHRPHVRQEPFMQITQQLNDTKRTETFRSQQPILSSTEVSNTTYKSLNRFEVRKLWTILQRI